MPRGAKFMIYQANLSEWIKIYLLELANHFNYCTTCSEFPDELKHAIMLLYPSTNRMKKVKKNKLKTCKNSDQHLENTWEIDA